MKTPNNDGQHLVPQHVGRPSSWSEHTQVMLNSYRRWLGAELIPREGTDDQQADELFEAPFVVVSHGTQDDPILSYGNRTALTLWEMDIATLTNTPSRLTAEPMHRAERTRLLQLTGTQGYVDDYRGIRISRSGKRFLIERAVVWNLVDEHNVRVGQAATFSQWRLLDGDTE